MTREITIGDYLISSLQKAGVNDIFGIPGDYVIKFFSELEKSEINTIGTCSEQGAAFAADAYARVNGIGALCVTYCVGGLNTINAVAGAYAEKAPLIVISGAPGINERNTSYLLHHSIKDLNSQLNIFKEVTVAQCVLDDAQNAPYEINRVISACLKHKRPVYIELPRDMIEEKCLIPPPKTEAISSKNSDSFDEAMKEAISMIKTAKKPFILGGVEIRRYNLEKEFLKLLDNTGFPYATNILGKSIIDESNFQFLGIYMGEIGDPNVMKYLEESDCTIILGALMTDTDTGAAQFNVSKTIYASSDEFYIKHHFFKDIDLGEFIYRLSIEFNQNETSIQKDELKTLKEAKNNEIADYIVEPEKPIKIKRFFERLNTFIPQGSPVICDVGDCLFGSATLKIPKDSYYLGPAFYTSMGYAIPAALGVLVKNPESRPIIFVGDGAFQMTGHELSCFVKYNFKPIIFVINNKGYTTQRFLKEGNYNNILDWNYHLFPQIVGDGIGLEVHTESDLEEALSKALNNTECFTIINIHLDKYDKSDTLYKVTSILGKK